MAHNLLIRKVNISNYTTKEIDQMSQNEINKLAKLFTMKGNNRENIKNILYYLHKLDEENITLLSDIKNVILQNLDELEINEINFETLKFNDVIKLLKTHRNKALIRKSLYNYIEKIVLYNVLNIEFEKFDDLEYIELISKRLPKNITLKIINNNKKRLLKNHSIEDINNLIELIDFMNFVNLQTKSSSLDIRSNMSKLLDFLIDLIEIKEIGLAKPVFDIATKYKFIVTIANNHYSFIEYWLLVTSSNQHQNFFVLNTLLNFIGEDNFVSHFNNIVVSLYTSSVKRILYMLIMLGEYKLLTKILDILIIKNYEGSKLINMMLPQLNDAIKSKNNNRLMEYINLIY